MKTFFTNLCLLVFCLLIASDYAYTQNHVKWPEATQSSKPWTRWWWMGNAVDEANLLRELEEFSDKGIGGVEITPIYGVKGEEDNFIEFLSPRFSEVLNYTINEANKLGMGVDLPPGSGWRCGAPFVPEEKGLWNLKVQKQKVKKGETWKLNQPKSSVAAVSFVANGKSEIVKSDSFTAPRRGIVYTAMRRKSGDKVKRPAKGGEGWAIDTFNEDITTWYLSEIWKRLDVEDGKLRCFFHDSFEYTGDFTTHFTNEFKQRRGYDLGNYLHILAGDVNDKELVARVKSDYRETLADLVLESFINPMTEWAQNHGAFNRNQAHGSPGNILDLYAACDIPETEFFGILEPGNPTYFIQKFASSAAHVTGKKLISSESYTWLDEHWTVTPADMMRATNGLFIAGVNHMFFHGTCYSPENATWPGWLFYASTQINNRNSLWNELPALFKYIERVQTIMQQSTPLNDVLVYWPYYDVAAGEGHLFNHIGVNDVDWFYNQPIADLSDKLVKNGYTFDYISDTQLGACELVNGEIISSGKSKYKAIVVPKCTYIPLKTMQKLNEFMDKGGKVVFDAKLPESVPGLYRLQSRQNDFENSKRKIDASCIGDAVELLSDNEITGEKDLGKANFHYQKMQINAETYYLIFNVDSIYKDDWIDLGTAAENYVLMNPLPGSINRAARKGNAVRIQLEPEQAIFVKCSNKNASLPDFVYEEQSNKKETLKTSWRIEFKEGGPTYPNNMETDKLLSWTDLGNDDAQRFAGTVKYSTEFTWTGGKKWHVIDLGKVKDCAHVYLNDEDLGSLLGPSFKVRTDKLQKGTNKLVVEVSNVAANRIRDLDRKEVPWRNFHDINFVNIDYKTFDASDWPIRPAGLLGPVTISYSADE